MKNVTLNHTYQIDFTRHEIRNLSDGSSKTLEPRLIHILQMLVNQQNQVLPRKEIIAAIWGNYASGEELLTHSICLIRNALDKSLILTVPKSGYILVADVVHDSAFGHKFRDKFTVKRVTVVLFALMMLKMIFFPHH